MVKLNVFTMLNSLSEEESKEADRIADTIPKFLLGCPNYEKMNAVELYNRWVFSTGLKPSTDRLLQWTYLFISYFAKEVPRDLLELQVNSKPEPVNTNDYRYKFSN